MPHTLGSQGVTQPDPTLKNLGYPRSWYKFGKND